jgi:putative hydrolase of the HAD superfamily
VSVRRITLAVVGIDAVIFDWGGTLTPWHDVEPINAWIDAVRDEDLAGRLHAAEEEVWARARTDHLSGTLDDVFRAVGITPDDATRRALHDWWEPHTRIDPDVPPLFQALRARGIRIGVLSNTLWPRAEHERIFARDGVLALLDGAVYSSEVPWTKPHPQVFAAALVAVGVDDARRAVYVGDRLYEDVYGARSAGMRAVLVPHSNIPAHQLVEVDEAHQPDAVIERLADLLAVVDAWVEAPC